jgi:hypothetical protein
MVVKRGLLLSGKIIINDVDYRVLRIIFESKGQYMIRG